MGKMAIGITGTHKYQIREQLFTSIIFGFLGSLNTDLAVSDIYGNFYILLAGVGLLDPNHIPSTITTTSTIKTEGNTEK